jgi:hypothetical protein
MLSGSDHFDGQDDLWTQRRFEDLIQVVLGFQKLPQFTEAELNLLQDDDYAAMIKAGRSKRVVKRGGTIRSCLLSHGHVIPAHHV